MEDKKVSQIISIEMEAQNRPDFKPVRKGGTQYISYGLNNDYPSYLIDLFNRCAEHHSIVTGKANYVYGAGLSYEKVNDPKIDGKVEQFLGKANPFESWNDLLKKIAINFEIIDGFYLQHIYGKNGKIVSTYNIDSTRIRRTECGKKFLYCEDWSNNKKVADAIEYPEYNESIKTGTCIRYVKVYQPSPTLFGSTYSIPNYIGALSAIETDINIDLFFNTMSEHGMTAQGMLSLFNGIPTDDEQRIIKKQFEKNYTGPRKAAQFLLNFVDPGGQPAELTNFSASDLDKQFEILGKRVQQKIFIGHKVDPVLFGVDTATSWNRPQMLEKWEKFNIAYVEPRQEFLLNVIKDIAVNNGVNAEALKIDSLPPIGEEFELSEAIFTNTLTIEEQRNYLRDKKGVELSSFDEDSTSSRLSLAQKLGVGGSTALQQLIIDQTIQPETKVQIMVGLYSVPEKKARKMLGILPPPPPLDENGKPVAMSAVKDTVLERLIKLAKVSNNDEILEQHFVNFRSHEDAINFENAQKTKFAEVLGGTVAEVRNQILDLLAGDPFIKTELIAKQLGTDVEYVNEQLAQMIDKGLINSIGNGFNITEKGLNKAESIDAVVETEIYTVYKYALSEQSDYNNKKGYIDTSHQFCKDMMDKSNSGFEWTREDLDGEENDFNMSAWVYRGGFTGHKNGETTSYCNHVWQAVTKVRKRGKNG